MRSDEEEEKNFQFSFESDFQTDVERLRKDLEKIDLTICIKLLSIVSFLHNSVFCAKRVFFIFRSLFISWMSCKMINEIESVFMAFLAPSPPFTQNEGHKYLRHGRGSFHRNQVVPTEPPTASIKSRAD